jgi:hypothetical protein
MIPLSRNKEYGTVVDWPALRKVKTNQSVTIIAKGSITAQVSPKRLAEYLTLKSLFVSSNNNFLFDQIW